MVYNESTDDESQLTINRQLRTELVSGCLRLALF